MDPPSTTPRITKDAYHKKKQETRRFYCKVALIIIFLFVLIAAAVTFVNFTFMQGKESEVTFGTSKGYLKAALFYHMAVNKSASPCDDFYEHACGKYMAENPIPPHMASFEEATRLDEESQKNMNNLLQSPEKSTSSAINKLKIVHRACLNQDAFVTKAPKVTLDTIKKYDTWPLLDVASTSDPSFKIQDVLEKMGKDLNIGSPLFSFGLGRDPADQSIRILSFDQPDLLMSIEYYLDPKGHEKEWKAMKKMLVDMISQFSKDIGIQVNPQLEKEIDDIMGFVANLAKIMKRNSERRDAFKMYNLRSFKEFNHEMKEMMNFDLKQYALAINLPETHSVINDADLRINLADLEFPKKLSEVMKKTDPKLIQNYLMLSVFKSFKQFFGQKYRDIEFDYKKEIYGLSEQDPWWKSCNEAAASTLEKAYGAMYARHYFDEESKRTMEVMISNLKESLNEMIQQSSWMDEPTKSKAFLKIKEQIPLIGYSKYAFNDTLLDEYYDKLNISESDDLLKIDEKIRIFNNAKEVEKYMKPVDRHDFFDQAAEVNAFNGFNSNSILFPAAILQFPFFEKDQPVAMNYGAMGSVIGHEITHGFDDHGKSYDDKGNLKNWWSEATLKQYREKAQCMVEQYGALEVPETGGLKINGMLTLGENIADNGGIRESFRAYQRYVSKHGPEPSLPGIEATTEQLFFYGFANSWCSNQRIGSLKEQILNDYHTPNRYRTNIVLQNSEDFSKAFNCPLGSPMNPKKKCSVW